jgi:hypothetical protein
LESQGEACPICASLGAFNEQGVFNLYEKQKEKHIKLLKTPSLFQ